ncbi:4245_t:CDS:2, partial [Gigaspora margarita]
IEGDLFYFSPIFLSLFGTKLTDIGMSALKDLENLVELYLDRTLITSVVLFI